MPRNLSSLFFAAVLACVSQISSSAGEFSKPSDTVGYADAFGNLKFNGHLGTIQLSRTEIYNFYFQYSSYENYESPFLGKGFFVPMLEATLIDHDYYLEATTMGGSIVYMYRLPAEPDRYVSLSGHNSATKLKGDKYIRETKEGYKFEYHEGQLNRMQTPNGMGVIFEYDGELCKTIRTSTGVVICSINKIADDAKSSFKTSAGKHELEFQIHPISNDTAMHSSNLPPLYTLKTIAWPNGAETQFTYAEIPDSGDIKMQMRYQDDVMDFIWNKQTAQLSSADKVEYKISPLVRNTPGRRERVVTGIYTIHQEFEDGSWELFSHDEDAGYSDVEKSNGEIIRTHYINTRGPVFNRVSKRSRIRRDDNVNREKVFYEAYYDAEGDLLRQVREGKITWHLRKGGIPESIVKDTDNLVRYDNKGRVVSERYNDSITKTQWLKDDVSRVVSRHPWGEINLRYYDPSGNPMPIPSSETFAEKSSL